MMSQLRENIVTHWLKDDFYALSADKPERGHKVRIAGDDNEQTHCFAKRQTGHIWTDPHVDAF